MNVNAAFEQAVRMTARAEDERVSDFARRAKIPHGTLRGHLSGRSQPGIEHLERLQEAGVDVAAVMSGKISFTAADPALSVDWPMLEGAHAGNALLGLMFVRAFQSILFRRIADASDAFVAKYHGEVGEGGKALSCRECVAVMIAHWVCATDRLRILASAPEGEAKDVAALPMRSIVRILLLNVPEAPIWMAIAQVAENERAPGRERSESGQ